MSAIKSLAADISRKELKMKRAGELKSSKAAVEEVKAKLAQAGVRVSNGLVSKKAALKALGEVESEYCKILVELDLDASWYEVKRELGKFFKAAKKHPNALFCASPSHDDGDDSFCWLGQPISTAEAQRIIQENGGDGLIVKKGKYYDIVD
jgi:hypothetical protein